MRVVGILFFCFFSVYISAGNVSELIKNARDSQARSDLVNRIYNGTIYASLIKTIRPEIFDLDNIEALSHREIYVLLAISHVSSNRNEGLLKRIIVEVEMRDQLDLENQCNLAYIYDIGLGVERDPERAHVLYQMAAENGSPLAECLIGIMYARYAFETCRRDQYIERAFTWLTRVAKENWPYAQLELGIMYQQGLGVEIDLPKALELIRSAAEQGLSGAQCHLAKMYLTGKGVEQNALEAFKWFMLAAEQNYPRANYYLSAMYLHGSIAIIDFDKALLYAQNEYENGIQECGKEMIDKIHKAQKSLKSSFLEN